MATGANRDEALLAHHFFAAFVGLEFGFVSRAVLLFAFFDEPVAVLFERGNVFGNFGDGGERIGGDDRRAEATGEEAVVNGADFEWVGVSSRMRPKSALWPETTLVCRRAGASAAVGSRMATTCSQPPAIWAGFIVVSCERSNL